MRLLLDRQTEETDRQSLLVEYRKTSSPTVAPSFSSHLATLDEEHTSTHRSPR
jgi:hypothetical protein